MARLTSLMCISPLTPAFALVFAFVLLASLTMASDIEQRGAQKSVARLDQAALREQLGGTERYLTHLSTDKPIYRAGEMVHVRGVMLHSATRTPLPSDTGANRAMVEIRGPKGDIAAKGTARIEQSVFGFAWEVPDDQPGGEYTLQISHPWTGDAPAERTFDIRAYRTPRLKTQIEFVREGYGPGDTVTATISVTRAEGGVPAPERTTITAVARVDSQEVHRGPAVMDQHGNATARFDLPDEIARGQGTLAFVIEDGGTVETATKTIPILLQTLDLHLYPEGGDLVVGLPNRMYVQAWTPYGDPADVKGIVVNNAGEEVAHVETVHEGRGRFEFTPRRNERYTLRITKPTGIETTYALPEAKQDEHGGGVVLQAVRQRYEAGRPVTLTVRSRAAVGVRRALKVTLSERERQVAVARLELDHQAPPNARTMHGSVEQQVTLTPPDSADGVLRATVWDDDGRPLAERLIYRQPTKRVHVEVQPDRSRYVPGDSVELTVRTRDEDGEPIAANIGLAVTDDSVLEMIETREQAPRLPAMALLEPEVRELADHHIYLSREEKIDDVRPAEALDLLLGTQGWRRFAFVDPTAFVETHGDDAKRVLALKLPRPVRQAQAQQGGVVGAAGAEVRALALVERQRRDDRLVEEVDRAAPPVEEMEKASDGDDEAAAGPIAANEPQPANRRSERAVQEPRGVQAEMEQAAQVAEQQRDNLALAAQDIARPGRRRVMRNDLVAVRVYAHEAPDNRPANQRTDFTETVYWNASVQTHADTGEATVTFDLSDSVTGFRVHADAFDRRGALGQGSALIESVEPFYIEPKMPLELTQGDAVRLPVTMVNTTDSAMHGLSFGVDVPDGLAVATPSQAVFELDPQQRLRQLIDINTTDFLGEAMFTFGADSASFRDRVQRSVMVQPRGFPVQIGRGGIIEADTTIAHRITIPKDLVPGSLTAKVNVHPTPMSNMTESLEGLIRHPYGCFEQTSSTTYPLAMAQQYFTTHRGVSPDLITRSSAMLEKGYQRLIGFECAERGYEWFGNDPMHPGLTAYGLMQFMDLAEIRDVDQDMIQRTRQRLLNVRDGEGNFKLATHALHGWVPDQQLSNAYVTWALLESGEDMTMLDREIKHVLARAPGSDNSYLHALAANIASLAGHENEAASLMRGLAQRQNDEGLVEGGTGTIVGSRGVSLNIETTALATLAWLRDPAYAGNVRKSIEWLAEQCKGGRYGSTQSTVLALRCIVRYDKQRAHPTSSGALQLIVDGEAVGQPVAFDEDITGTIELPDISNHLGNGEHAIALEMSDGSSMPYSLTIDFHRLQPDSSEQSPLRLDVSLNEDTVREGEVTEAHVIVQHTGDEPVSMPTAIVGIPSGLEVRHDQLKELVEAGTIAAYEVIGREVVLYWRVFEPGEQVELPLSLVAAVPGRFTGPASRAYLYYGDEHKQWVPGLAVTVTPRQ